MERNPEVYSSSACKGTTTAWRILENPYGQYCRILEECPVGIVLDYPGPDLILDHLTLVYGIGPKTAQSLRKSGYDTLEKLTDHPKWGPAAREICGLIQKRNIQRLQRYGAREEELVGFFPRSDLVFLDLETTGLSSIHPVFLVGVFYFEGEIPVIKQFLARDFTEEKAMLYAVEGLLNRFQVAISYNGRSFDLPYLKGRMRFHNLQWRDFPQQFDLLRQTRRYYKEDLPDFRLTTAGRRLLNEVRQDTISGRDVPERYHMFMQTREATWIDEILLHNKEDLLTMAGLVKVITTRVRAIANRKGKEFGKNVG